MKFKKCLIFILLAILLPFSGCSNSNKVHYLEAQIDDIYEEYYQTIALVKDPNVLRSEVILVDYYITNMDSVMLYIVYENKEKEDLQITVANFYTYDVDTATELTVWKDNVFYDLKYAKQEYYLGEKRVVSNTTLLAFTFAVKGQKELIIQILSDYAEHVKSQPYFAFDVDYLNVICTRFYGEYNGAYVFYFAERFDSIPEASFDIEGYNIPFPGLTPHGQVWYEGAMYTFIEAYELGLLCLEDFLTIKAIVESQYPIFESS